MNNTTATAQATAVAEAKWDEARNACEGARHAVRLEAMRTPTASDGDQSPRFQNGREVETAEQIAEANYVAAKVAMLAAWDARAN